MPSDIDLQDGFVILNGKRVHFLHAGSGAPLVLLHSNGGSAYEYEDMFPLLAPRFRVIAWDMPGQGDSDALGQHLSVEDYANSVIALLDALRIPKAFVVGASIGGAICVSLAAHHKDRLLRPIVVECPFRSTLEWKRMWPNTELNYSDTKQSRETIAARLRVLTDHHMTRWNIDRCKAGTKTMLSVMWALREFDVDACLRRIETNVGLIFGDRSPTVGKADLFRSILPRCKVIVLPDTGHFPMLDDPPEFAKAIAEMTEPDQSIAGASL